MKGVTFILRHRVVLMSKVNTESLSQA